MARIRLLGSPSPQDGSWPRRILMQRTPRCPCERLGARRTFQAPWRKRSASRVTVAATSTRVTTGTGNASNRHEVGDVIRFGGLATLAEVWLDGERILTSENMFHEHVLDVSGRLHGGSELAIRFRALGHALRAKRPRPRWRATIVQEQQLRWFRTSLLGRIPAWTPPIAPVGPYRPITTEARSAIAAADVRTRVEGTTGIVEATVDVRDDVRAVDARRRRISGDARRQTQRRERER